MKAQIGIPAAAIRAHEELFTYWTSLRDGARLPARRDLDPAGMKRLLPTVSLIDVARRDPMDFRVRLAGTGLYGVYGGEITGKSLAERRPTVGVHNLAWRGASHLSILWLRLPLAANGSEVDMILGYDAVVGLGHMASGIRAA